MYKHTSTLSCILRNMLTEDFQLINSFISCIIVVIKYDNMKINYIRSVIRQKYYLKIAGNPEPNLKIRSWIYLDKYFNTNSKNCKH